MAYQPPWFEVVPRAAWDLRRRTEIIPVLTNGHGRYITVTPERKLVPVGEWPLNIAIINV
jgi:hypothetical protein